MDSRMAIFKSRLNILNSLKKEHRLPFLLYRKLYKAVEYDHRKS